jgi:hypothetical protein
MSLFIAAAAVAGEDSAKAVAVGSTATVVDTTADATVTSQVVVSYLHGNRRCPTCMKIEAYSEEAVRGGFAEELADSSLVWQAVNFDEKDNSHLVEHYQLYTQTLIVSRVQDGQEAEWSNLDQIWKLVGDKDKFVEYVQTEVADFMTPDSTE